VWWEDTEQNTLDLRGSIENDIIFQEAERLGFDIREGSAEDTMETMDSNDLESEARNNQKTHFQLFSKNSSEESGLNKKRKLGEDVEETTELAAENYSIHIQFNMKEMQEVVKKFCLDR
jgi:hypothetical protein